MNLKWWTDNKILEEKRPSKAEQRIIRVFRELRVEFHREVCFEGLMSRKGFPLRYDFYFPSRNLLIEYDGKHHSQAIFVENDGIKNEFALNHGLRLVRLNAKNWKDLEMKIFNALRNYGVIKNIRRSSRPIDLIQDKRKMTRKEIIEKMSNRGKVKSRKPVHAFMQ